MPGHWPLGEFCCCVFISKTVWISTGIPQKWCDYTECAQKQVQHSPVEFDSFWSQHLCFEFDSLWFKIWVTVATSLNSAEETGWRLNTIRRFFSYIYLVITKYSSGHKNRFPLDPFVQSKAFQISLIQNAVSIPGQDIVVGTCVHRAAPTILPTCSSSA